MTPERMTAPPARPRRDRTDRLRAALTALCTGRVRILTHSERPWASITFAGARHSFALLFAGEDAIAAGERFVETLPEHEFALAGQLVADAAVVEVEHRLCPFPRMVVRCELLLLDDS